MLAEVARLLPHEPDAARAEEAIVLAAQYHDAIYEVGVDVAPGSSEEASAELAVAQIGPGPLADEVARLIRLTVGHAVDPDDRPGAVLVDADLWILSAPADRYDRYVADVRVEYAHVPDDAWQAGRGQVLDRFLAAAESGELYTAGPSDDRAARRTRAIGNLTRERAALDPGAGGGS